MAGNTLMAGTYLVEGDAHVSGSPGTAASPIPLSIIATGSIEISGNPDLRPDAPEILFVTDGDLKISGGLTLPMNVEGQILVREQLHISGNPNLFGQIVVENVPEREQLGHREHHFRQPLHHLQRTRRRRRHAQRHRLAGNPLMSRLQTSLCAAAAVMAALLTSVPVTGTQGSVSSRRPRPRGGPR